VAKSAAIKRRTFTTVSIHLIDTFSTVLALVFDTIINIDLTSFTGESEHTPTPEPSFLNQLTSPSVLTWIAETGVNLMLANWPMKSHRTNAFSPRRLTTSAVLAGRFQAGIAFCQDILWRAFGVTIEHSSSQNKLVTNRFWAFTTRNPGLNEPAFYPFAQPILKQYPIKLLLFKI
jgi:hypothetical protein